MPPGKRRQSNAMLYTLITFVGLFIVATTVAVIYYVKAEELRTRSDDLQEQVDLLANREEVRGLGSIVGTKMPGHSNLGTVVAHLDEMVRLVQGPAGPGDIRRGEGLQHGQAHRAPAATGGELHHPADPAGAGPQHHRSQQSAGPERGQARPGGPDRADRRLADQARADDAAEERHRRAVDDAAPAVRRRDQDHAGHRTGPDGPGQRVLSAGPADQDRLQRPAGPGAAELRRAGQDAARSARQDADRVHAVESEPDQDTGRAERRPGPAPGRPGGGHRDQALAGHRVHRLQGRRRGHPGR